MSETSARVTVQVECPMHAGTDTPCGEAVRADFGTFADTTVAVRPCAELIRQGWGSRPQWVGRKSYAGVVLVPVDEAPAPVRHADSQISQNIRPGRVAGPCCGWDVEYAQVCTATPGVLHPSGNLIALCPPERDCIDAVMHRAHDTGWHTSRGTAVAAWYQQHVRQGIDRQGCQGVD